MTPIHHLRMSHPFQGEVDPLRTQGEGGRDESPFSRRGGGTVMSHPKRGGGIVISHPKGACPKGGSTNHNQRERVVKRGVSLGRLHQSQPKGEGGGQIMLICTQSVYPSTAESWWPAICDVERAANQ